MPIALTENAAARRLIARLTHGNRNIMTPTVLVCGFIGPYTVEVSKGEGIMKDPIWGVSIWDTDTGHNLTETEGCCFSETQVNDYLAALAARVAA